MRLRQCFAYALILLIAVAAAGFGPTGGGFDLSWNTIDDGGGRSTGGGFELHGTIGQADAGAPMTGGGFQIAGGFWPGVNPPDGVDCPADLNGDGFVNGIDLGILLGNWSIPPTAPGCEAVIPCAADLNGDGLVNGIDLGLLLGNWSIPPSAPGCL